MLLQIKKQFYRPVDNSPIILFRILFGLLMAVESFGAIGTGWVKKTLVDPEFTFSFIGLEWLQPLAGDGMYYYFAVMGVVSLMVMVGYRYRVSAVILAVMWTAVYFMQKSSYNNHYYLTMLLAWVMAMMDANGYASLDAKRTNQERHFCPNWYRWFFILQLLIVFSYGALAKLYPGWMEGTFIHNAFSRKTHYWVIGSLLGKEWFQLFITYAGIIFDALIIPALMWKRTRLLAFIGLWGFNIFNSVVFQVGIFPYMVIAMTVFFFEPETIRDIFFPKKIAKQKADFSKKTASDSNFSKTKNNTFTFIKNKIPAYSFYLFVIYFVVQFALPLRHHFIEGDVNWREEGHRMSWRMMLRAKSGQLKLEVVNPKTNEKWTVKLRDYLTRNQLPSLTTKPDFLWQFVQRLKKEYADKGINDVEIYVKKSKVRLNRGTARPFFKKEVDLAKVEWNYFGRNDWVLD